MRLLLTAENTGDVWNYVLNLTKGLKNFEVDVRVAIIGNDLTDSQKEEINFAKYYFFRSRQEWMKDPWNDIDSAGKWLLSLAENIKPDVVHLNSYSFGSLPWKIPVVMTAHSCIMSWFEAVRNESASGEWNDYTSRVTHGIRAADVIVTPSYDLMKAVEKYYQPAGRKLVIYNGADPSDYHFDKKENYIFSIGRLWDEAKNIRLILEAAPFIKQDIIISGKTGKMPDNLSANVHLTGQLTRRQVAELLSKASVYLLPVKYEPSGYTFLEAALSGCAIITGDIPSMREIWGDAAVYAGTDDSRALSRTVNALMSVPEWRRHLSAKAHARAVSEFENGLMASRYNLLYNNLVNIRIKRLIKDIPAISGLNNY